MIQHHVFGPVASRRLGVSLGIDLVPHKTCSLDCVYCEARRTTCLTTERKEYVPISEVLQELDQVLKTAPQLDFITFSGSGEPTLNSGIGRVVDFIKEHYPQYPVCLLTNGCSLGDRELRREIARVDRIVPSLDASNEEEFRLVNRPAPGLRFEQFVADLTDFTHHTDADLYLELFILPGVNDSDESIQRFVELISKMKLTMVQLNTLDRPGTESWVKPSPAENTRRFIRALEPIVPVEAVGPFRYRSRSREHAPELCTGAERAILDLVERRPATLADLTVALGLPQEEIQILLDSLFKFGLLEMEKQERGTFYAPARH
ncbi:radical SAM protein [Victivallis sp.]|uniref:radical SAM protein n=1 Tax=Victivallis sp. TaxID=2049020 RepID=UPI0025DE851D|nr:radical SAM protein [uncultured Victivallis sp.]